jgi:hypothetical protein
LALENNSQLQHQNQWIATAAPGFGVGCFGAVIKYNAATGQISELGRAFSGHGTDQPGQNGNVSIVSADTALYNVPVSSIGNIPYSNYFSMGDPSFAGNGANIGATNGLQSYVDAQGGSSFLGRNTAIDYNSFVPCGIESLGCGPTRTVTATSTQNVYDVGILGSVTPSSVAYKTQPIVAFAGQNIFTEVSGPASSSITALASTPWSVCYAYKAGECIETSTINHAYMNVPQMYNPGYCTAGVSWAFIPCIFMGDNAPAGSIRRYKTSASYSAGAFSQNIGSGLSRMGSTYVFSNANTSSDGGRALVLGNNMWDGFAFAPASANLPPWQERPLDPNNSWKRMPVTIPGGHAYADVEFWRSRDLAGAAPSSTNGCTRRSEPCTTDVPQPFTNSNPFAFDQTDTKTLTPCSTGCTVYVPMIGPGLYYWRVRQSDDGGATWANGSTQIVVMQ